MADYLPGNNSQCEEWNFNGDGIWNGTGVWGGISGSNGNWKYDHCVLTTGIGNTVMGTASNNALWSLALILLVMSLAFNLLMRLVSKKGAR